MSFFLKGWLMRGLVGIAYSLEQKILDVRSEFAFGQSTLLHFCVLTYMFSILWILAVFGITDNTIALNNDWIASVNRRFG